MTSFPFSRARMAVWNCAMYGTEIWWEGQAGLLASVRRFAAKFAKAICGLPKCADYFFFAQYNTYSSLVSLNRLLWWVL